MSGEKRPPNDLTDFIIQQAIESVQSKHAEIPSGEELEELIINEARRIVSSANDAKNS